MTELVHDSAKKPAGPIGPDAAPHGGFTSMATHRLVRALMPVFLVIEVLGSPLCFQAALRGKTDFRQFYTGARLMQLGYRHDLYNYALQMKIGGTSLPSVHPAYEYLLFLPLSFLTYKIAFLVWLLINACLILAAVRLLQPNLNASRWMAVGILIAFIPVWITCYEGQDALLLLVLLLLANRTSGVRSGLWIGLGAFKFHLILPIALLHLLWKKWGVVAGICVSAGSAGLVSVAIVGIDGSVHYAKEASSMALSVLRPGVMPNVHGLLLRAFGSTFGSSHLVTWLTVIVALVILIWASRQTPSLALATLVVPFCAPYLLPYDLTVLLLPIMTFDLWLVWAGGILALGSGAFGGFAVLPIAADLFRHKVLQRSNS